MSLKQDWLVYDWDEGVYTSFIPKIHNDYQSLTLILNPQDYSNEIMQLWFDEPLDIFVNNKLFYSLDANQQLNVTLAELQLKDEDSLLSLSVHSSAVFRTVPKIMITQKDLLVATTYYFKSTEEIANRSKSLFEDKLLLIVVFLIIGFTISNLSPLNPILSFTSIDGILTFFTDNKRGLNFKIGISTMIIYLVLLASIISIIILMIDIKPDFFGFEITSIVSLPGIFSALNYFISLFVFIVVVMLFKLLLIWFVGVLFNLKDETSIHLYEFMAFSNLFYISVFCLALTIGFYPHFININFLVKIFEYGFLIIAIMLSLKVYRVISFKNVFIISYFCITEFVPAFIMVRFF